MLSQNYRNYEYVLIDGKSTDKTLDIVNEYCSKDQRMRCFSEPDTGIYNAMNRGLSKAEGEYVLFLNAGDLFYNNDILEKVKEEIESVQGDIIIGNYAEMKHGMENIILLGSAEECVENIKRGIPICHQALFTRRKLLKKGFDERYKIAADYEWFCRSVHNNCRVIKIDDIVSRYEGYGISSMALNWRQLQRECVQIVGEYFTENVSYVQVEKQRLFPFIKCWKQYECLNDMFALKQQGNGIADYFVQKGVKTAAVYGFHYLGQRVCDELESAGIMVKYVIDNAGDKFGFNRIVKGIEDTLDPVDVIVVTPIFDYTEIKKQLEKKIDCWITSIETAINDMYEIYR